MTTHHPGDVVGDHVLLSPVHVGGMGEVGHARRAGGPAGGGPSSSSARHSGRTAWRARDCAGGPQPRGRGVAARRPDDRARAGSPRARVDRGESLRRRSCTGPPCHRQRWRFSSASAPTGSPPPPRRCGAPGREALEHRAVRARRGPGRLRDLPGPRGRPA
jgi:hypothetical protein